MIIVLASELTFLYNLWPVSTFSVPASGATVPLLDDLHVIAVRVLRILLFSFSLFLFPNKNEKREKPGGNSCNIFAELQTNLSINAERRKRILGWIYFFVFSVSEERLMEDSSVSDTMKSSILSSSKKPWREKKVQKWGRSIENKDILLGGTSRSWGAASVCVVCSSDASVCQNSICRNIPHSVRYADAHSFNYQV